MVVIHSSWSLSLGTIDVIIDVAEGMPSSIPCSDVIKPVDGDSLLLVLFYRDEDFSRPIFTYDSRYPQARQWFASTLNDRHFTFKIEEAQLEIDRVFSSDHGIWHCRVEFEISPSRTQSAKLNVIGNSAEISLEGFYVIS